jgi:hypothetical protein
VLVAGNDRNFSVFVQKYVNMVLKKVYTDKQWKQGAFDRLDLRIFFIPFGYSILGKYMAMYDPIYCQQIYLPFTSNPFFEFNYE